MLYARSRPSVRPPGRREGGVVKARLGCDTFGSDAMLGLRM